MQNNNSKIEQYEETDFYNLTMDNLGPEETKTGHSIWQAIPRDVGIYKSPRVMAGSKAIIRDYQQFYGGGLEFCLLKDGMPFLAGDPVFQVIGDKSIARKLEPKILSTLFYMTEVATRTKELVDEFGANRIIEVGMRAQAPGSWKYSAEAFVIGGGKLTSNTAIKNVPGLIEGRDYSLVGTTGHSLYLEYLSAGYTQKEAFSEILDKFEKNYPGKPCSLLVDTVESMLGITQALEVIKDRIKTSNQVHYIRLDSGNLLNQALYSLQEMRGVSGFKVIIENGLVKEQMRSLDHSIKSAGFNPEESIIYGAGGYFVNNITRDSNGAWAYKPSIITTTNNGSVPVIKESNDSIKNSLPGLIGIQYDLLERRLTLHNSYSINKILDKREQEKYLEQPIAELTKSAKEYWKKMTEIPSRWLETYSMSKELSSMQHDAKKRIHAFGYGDKENLVYKPQINKLWRATQCEYIESTQTA